MSKYNPAPKIPIQNRVWPSKSITTSPVWCSVDLRDGNQALPVPMSVEEKLKFFDLLVKVGFKQIEAGFPSSSATEFDFLRRLIAEERVPDDVTLQVLCQSRSSLVEKTFDAIKGLKKVIFHIYNSTSPAQRKYTFGKSKEEILKIPLESVELIKNHLSAMCESERPCVQLEYSPESFSMTEIDYALQICEAVGNAWGWSKENKIIFNLPTTVECYTANVYADAVEYFSNHISHRDCVIISTHCHNDRGTAVSSAELALLAGAERVEGCLFGNGERTGNLDIVTMALNMFSEGINPNLDFSDLNSIAKTYCECTKMTIPVRQPYSGELVFTAFSGSHQDAIRKAMNARLAKLGSDGNPENIVWDVPYLLIDPQDIGREYEEIIRINSQSGKGGSAWILEHEFGLSLPKAMHPILGSLVKNKTDSLQRELSSEEIYEVFKKTWLEQENPAITILDFVETHADGSDESNNVLCRAVISVNGNSIPIGAKGNGPVAAFVSAIKQVDAVPDFVVTSFSEHSVGSGADTDAISYIEINLSEDAKYWGVGRSPNVARAGINAVVSALNQVPQLAEN